MSKNINRIRQIAETLGNVQQTARDRIEYNTTHVKASLFTKSREDLDFYLDNWERLESNQIEIVSTHIETAIELFYKCKEVEKEPKRFYFNLWSSSLLLMIISFYGTLYLVSYSIMEGMFDIYDFFIPLYVFSIFAEVYLNSPEITSEDKDIAIKVLENRPKEMQLGDTILVCGFILFFAGVLLYIFRMIVRAKEKRRRVFMIKGSLKNQLTMVKRLYTFLSSEKKHYLHQQTFRYPNPKYFEGSTYHKKYIEFSWAKLPIKRWLREEFRD